jgi:hypothetical protein
MCCACNDIYCFCNDIYCFCNDISFACNDCHRPCNDIYRSWRSERPPSSRIFLLRGCDWSKVSNIPPEGLCLAGRCRIFLLMGCDRSDIYYSRRGERLPSRRPTSSGRLCAKRRFLRRRGASGWASHTYPTPTLLLTYPLPTPSLLLFEAEGRLRVGILPLSYPQQVTVFLKATPCCSPLV